MPPVVFCRALEKSYGERTVLRGVNLTIHAGETVALLGCNGAGKSTLLRVLLGLLRPDAGQVQLWGQSPDAAARRRIGYLPEDCGLYDRMRVDETIAFFGGIHGLKKPEIRRRSQPLLEAMGLADRLRNRIQTLSKGNQQKIKLICALMHQPEFLIFDEPFSGLDVEGTRLLSQALRDCRQQGITLLLSSHRLDQMEQLADRALVLHDGVIRLDRPMDETCRGGPAGPWEIQLPPDISVPEASFSALPGVHYIEAQGLVRRFFLHDHASPTAVLKELLRREVPLQSFGARRLSLEQAYVEATGGAILRGGDS